MLVLGALVWAVCGEVLLGLVLLLVAWPLRQLRYLAFFLFADGGEHRRLWVVRAKLGLLTQMALAAARYEQQLRR
jgi:hypothetical protein